VNNIVCSSKAKERKTRNLKAMGATPNLKMKKRIPRFAQKTNRKKQHPESALV